MRGSANFAMKIDELASNALQQKIVEEGQMRSTAAI